MPTKSHADVLRSFKRVGRVYLSPIIDDPGRDWLVIEVPATEDRPGVYAWTEEQEGGDPVIIYIGSTGKTIWQRHRSHSSGFRRSNVGKRHMERISKRIQSGMSISVWAYYPEPVPFDGELVPVHRSFEEHLLANIDPKPALNREGKRIAD